MTEFAEALAQCLPTQDEMLTMAAEGFWPPPSILDPPDTAQAIWDGLATVRGLLEGHPVEDWPTLFPSAYAEDKADD